MLSSSHYYRQCDTERNNIADTPVNSFLNKSDIAQGHMHLKNQPSLFSKILREIGQTKRK